MSLRDIGISEPRKIGESIEHEYSLSLEGRKTEVILRVSTDRLLNLKTGMWDVKKTARGYCLSPGRPDMTIAEWLGLVEVGCKHLDADPSILAPIFKIAREG
jgi:hypothetical protein